MSDRETPDTPQTGLSARQTGQDGADSARDTDIATDAAESRTGARDVAAPQPAPGTAPQPTTDGDGGHVCDADCDAADGAHRCPYRNHATTGQAFSGGREWYCPGCDAIEEYPDPTPAPDLTAAEARALQPGEIVYADPDLRLAEREAGRYLTAAEFMAARGHDMPAGLRGLMAHMGIDTTGRDIRVGDEVVDRWATASFTDTPAPHSCSNCDGIDPDTCWSNPDRPPAPDPVEDFSYKWAHSVDTINGGRTLRIPWLNSDDVEAGSVWVFGTDAPALAHMLLDAAPAPPASAGLRETIAEAPECDCKPILCKGETVPRHRSDCASVGPEVFLRHWIVIAARSVVGRESRTDEAIAAAVMPVVEAWHDDSMRLVCSELDEAVSRAVDAETRTNQYAIKLGECIDRQHKAEAAITRVERLHQPIDYRGRTICAECSAWDPDSDTTDSSPVDHPCDTTITLHPPTPQKD